MRIPIRALVAAALVAAVQTSAQAQATRPLVAVFAHPDDERVIGPLLSRLAREGRETHLVIATDGAKGVREFAQIPAGAALAAARAKEASCAAERLGVRQLHLLGLPRCGSLGEIILISLQEEFVDHGICTTTAHASKERRLNLTLYKNAAAIGAYVRVPLPVAHALVGASVVAALLPLSRSRTAKPLLIGAILGVSPDFDYALNWLRISGGGWHHGFTHSIPFALVAGVLMLIVQREWKFRSFIVFSSAYGSHTLLDYLITESQGVALWWPFTDHRYKLRLPNPIEYSSVWESATELSKVCLTELMIFGPVLLVIVLIRVVMKRSRMKQSLGASISVVVVTLLAAIPAFSQDKQRLVHWPEIPFHANSAKSSTSTIVAQIDVLEIVDVTVGGKPVTLGESFAADDEWLKTLAVRVKNISSTSIAKVQLNLFLPQIMPGGPMVTLFYSGDAGKGIGPGEEVDIKVVHYDWLLGQINSKSSLANITKAEIQQMYVTLAGGKVLVSQCVKTAKQKNACVPNP